MAIVLGQKIVTDTKTYNDYAVGISLPIQVTNVAFTQTFQTIDQLKSNIKNLLLTVRGERLMQPEFGSGLYELLFEMNTDEFNQTVEDEIRTSLQRWLPIVTVDEVIVEESNVLRDTNQFNVSLKFSVGNSTESETVEFTVTE
jgi:phage baseplate assembly protein W